MSDIIHADVFFFITTLSVILLTGGLAIVLYYVIDILRDAKVVIKKIKKASDEIEQDFENLRTNVKNESMRVRNTFDLISGFIIRKIKKTRARAKAKAKKEI